MRALLDVGLVFALSTAAMAGCSASSEKPAVQSALDSPKVRRESFEATLRVLDQHPEYVDELFEETLRHKPTLERFLEDTARTLNDERLAHRTAVHLARYPDSLRETLVKTLDEVSDKPAAMRAAAQAMEERPEVAAMIIIQREDALRATFRSLVGEVQKNAEARRWFLDAMQENSVPLAKLLADNPHVLATLVKAFGDVGAHKGKQELDAFVKAIDPASAD